MICLLSLLFQNKHPFFLGEVHFPLRSLLFHPHKPIDVENPKKSIFFFDRCPNHNLNPSIDGQSLSKTGSSPIIEIHNNIAVQLDGLPDPLNVTFGKIVHPNFQLKESFVDSPPDHEQKVMNWLLEEFALVDFYDGKYHNILEKGEPLALLRHFEPAPHFL